MTQPEPARDNVARRWKFAGIALLLAAHVVLALWAVAGKSVMGDEIFHVTGGYLYDKYGDFRIQPDNGVLPQRLHGLPALLSGAKSPPLADSEYWRVSDLNVVSYQFFYESGNDHWPFLLRARALNLIFSVGIGLLVFAWARALAGDLAGFTALALTVFSPTLLAHGPLATTDAAAAFFLTASAGAFWWQLRATGIWSTLVSAVVFGLACVAKFSAVLLIPILTALLIVHLAVTPAARNRWHVLLLGLGAHAAAAVVLIWWCYGFRYSTFAPGVPAAEQFIMPWDWMLERAGWQSGVIRWIRDHRLLPEAFLFGYTHTYVGSLTRAAYLAGQFSDVGWPSFFPAAFLWKSTPVELIGVVLCCGLAAFHWRRMPDVLRRFAPLLVLGAIYGVVALKSHLNIGHRHLLPLYPALFIATGVAVSRLGLAQRPRLGVAAVMVGTQLVIALATFPNYLAYFNVIAGGPSHGWRLLVDSSLDWGQDLPGLKQWLEKNNAGATQPVFLSYFGTGSPEYYHLEAHWLPFVNGFKIPHRYVRLEAGVYCIGATTLSQVYSPVRGLWTLELEKEYQELRTLEPLFEAYVRDPVRRAELEQQAPREQWQNGWARHDLLRFARLCHYLRIRGPDADVGHSILIFRLSSDEVAAATAGSLADWRNLIERAAAKASVP
jgi:hypothetical protein